MTTEIDVRRQLADTEARIERLTAATRRVEGERDALIRKLCDVEGAHDRHPVAVR